MAERRTHTTDGNTCGAACHATPAALLMLRETGDNMKVLSKEKITVLAETNGWSLAHAEGFIDGENFRRRGTTPSKYAQIGIDDYCLGFRAGYYERLSLASVMGFPRLPMARSSLQRSKDSVETGGATIVPALSG